MRTIILASLTFSSIALAQDAPPRPSTPTIVMDSSDAAEFREIVETTIPVRYTSGIIRWYSALVQKSKQTPSTSAPADPTK